MYCTAFDGFRGRETMEPLGSITVYFPFLDEATKNTLESIMEKAYNYHDFVKILTQRVLETECSDVVVYFAVHHALQLLDLKTITAIGRKYNDIQILMPNLFFVSVFQGNPKDLDLVRKAAASVLATDPDDWLALEMHFMKFESETWQYPKVIHDTTNLDIILDMIKNESNFAFYETIYYSNLAMCAQLDGDSEERKRCNEKAIELSRKHDDKIRLAYNLHVKANIVESDDRKIAKEILVEAGDLMEHLGSYEGYSHIYENISKFEAIRGEFNIAIEHYLEVVSIRESLGLDNGKISLVLSTLYNTIGEFESGLEWGRMAEDQYRIMPNRIPRTVLNQAWSLTSLKKQTEATVLVDTVRETIVKSGKETDLAWLHFVTGVVELGDGDLISAMSSIEEALKIYETREGTMVIQILFLYYLARIEVSQSDMNTDVFPYLALLEERSILEDLPGILGQTLLLKSEVALFQNDDAQLRDIVQQLQPLAQEPRMAFLAPFYERLLNKI